MHVKAKHKGSMVVAELCCGEAFKSFPLSADKDKNALSMALPPPCLSVSSGSITIFIRLYYMKNMMPPIKTSSQYVLKQFKFDKKASFPS